MAGVHKYRASKAVTIANDLFVKGDFLYIENSTGFKQVFNSEKKFVGSISKSQYNQIVKNLEQIAE